MNADEATGCTNDVVKSSITTGNIVDVLQTFHTFITENKMHLFEQLSLLVNMLFGEDCRHVRHVCPRINTTFDALTLAEPIPIHRVSIF